MTQKPSPEQIARAQALQKQIDEIVAGKAKPSRPRNLKEFVDQATPPARKKAVAKKKA